MNDNDYDNSYRFPRFIVLRTPSQVLALNIGAGPIATVICDKLEDGIDNVKYVVKIKTIIGNENFTATFNVHGSDKVITTLLNKMGTIVEDR